MNLRSYRRFVAVVWQFLPLLVGYARDRRRFLLFGGSRRVSSETRVQRADRLLESLLTLGPTFIKLGQLLSTRPDILPPEYIDEFTKLQDEVPPASWDDARGVVEDELGPVDEVFEAFDTEAISGASLGQVYLAEYEGRQVAVKVRRPSVESLVEADLRVIRWTLPILMWLVGEARAFSLSTLADEFATTIRQEMDYEREASMLEEIRANFTGDETVAIPPVVEELSGPKVLTMEYIEGTKITNLKALDERGIDRSQIARDLDRAYLKMLLEDGVFHADPHPGNLAVQDDGTIVFYDFGMSGRIGESTQRTIIDFYVAVANRDIDAILDALVRLGTLSPDANMATMAKVMELAIEDARGQRVENWRVNQIVSQVEDTIYEFPFRLPSDLALVLRVATVVEGVCVTLDPDFDFIEVATSYLGEQGYREEGIRQFLDEFQGQVRESALSTIRTPPKLERMLDRFDRDDFYVRADIEDGNNVFDLLAKRVVYGMVLSAGLVSTAVLYPQPQPTIIAGGISVLIALLLYRSFRGRRGIRAKPQFTRQAMRERQEE